MHKILKNWDKNCPSEAISQGFNLTDFKQTKNIEEKVRF